MGRCTVGALADRRCVALAPSSEQRGNHGFRLQNKKCPGNSMQQDFLAIWNRRLLIAGAVFSVIILAWIFLHRKPHSLSDTNTEPASEEVAPSSQANATPPPRAALCNAPPVIKIPQRKTRKPRLPLKNSALPDRHTPTSFIRTIPPLWKNWWNTTPGLSNTTLLPRPA